ncbi:MAG TPA: methyltransferase domain-containing protein [Candidatus Binatia bacterium]|nr:methyltransferase domain-containing protein [Candidatus Binatia bacterium]
MRTIAGFAATCEALTVGDDTIALWRVADLEAHVDRAALLAGDDPAEPPYWAHLWTGARVLAAAVPRGPRRAVELGCGLGLPGLVAARRGARVTLVDRVPAALAFARASAVTNGCAVDAVAADVTAGAVRGRFDLVLAAELLYEREAFPAVAWALAALLAPGGQALVADAGRVDTRAFYEALGAAGLRWRTTEHRVLEEGLSLIVRLVVVGPR